MNYQCIVMHNEELETIVDAAVPNKAQNVAIKRQIRNACDTLMNRISSGWLEDSFGCAQSVNASSAEPINVPLLGGFVNVGSNATV